MNTKTIEKTLEKNTKIVEKNITSLNVWQQVHYQKPFIFHEIVHE